MGVATIPRGKLLGVHLLSYTSENTNGNVIGARQDTFALAGALFKGNSLLAFVLSNLV